MSEDIDLDEPVPLECSEGHAVRGHRCCAAHPHTLLGLCEECDELLAIEENWIDG